MVSLKIKKKKKNRWLIPLRKIEMVYAKDIQKMLSKYSKIYSKKYETIQQHDDIMDKLSFKKDLSEITIKHIKKAMQKSVAITSDQINLEMKSETFNIEDYLREYILTDAFEESMSSISVFYYKQLSNIIENGIKEELTRDQIAKNLQNTDKINKIRSKVIARTETHNASMYASEKRANDIADDLEIEMYKQWIPVEDSRVRPEHSRMRRAKTIPVNGMFTVGGAKMARPGDIRGGASNVVNCRCVLRYIVKD